MNTFDVLFGGSFGVCTDPRDMQAMSEEQLNAQELRLAYLTRNSQFTNYEALRNAFRAHEAWDDATVNQRYHDFCKRLSEAKKKAGLE